jgi:uncharacterized heparinase superfamily protein
MLFRRGEFKAKAACLDDRARWLFGAQADEIFDRIDTATVRLPVRREFPEGGYSILGHDFESPDEVKLVIDAGPLGYRAIAAHGHADALSFTLSIGGREFLVDPGTYAYHTDARWRAYFRGTSAHNTVRIDGLDQSEPGGNFLWLRKANAGCANCRVGGDEEDFEGWHDGYMRLADPVMHRRAVRLIKRERRIVIEDTLQMAGEHDVELFFHLSERCRVEVRGGVFAVALEGRSVEMTLPHGATTILVGSDEPIGGWVSRRFDEKVPAPTLRWKARVRGDCVLRSQIAY